MQLVEPIRDKKQIEAIKRILKEQNSRNFLLFLIGINSGLRISDILRLKIVDVKDTEYIEIKEKKTSKYKKFPITNSYKKELEEFIVDKKANEWLFPSKRNGNAITRIQAYRIINNACKKAGVIFRIGTHTLRKTFGYHHYQQFKDIALLQYIFNHSTPNITLTYIGINQDMIDSNLKNFNL